MPTSPVGLSEQKGSSGSAFIDPSHNLHENHVSYRLGGKSDQVVSYLRRASRYWLIGDESGIELNMQNRGTGVWDRRGMQSVVIGKSVQWP